MGLQPVTPGHNPVLCWGHLCRGWVRWRARYSGEIGAVKPLGHGLHACSHLEGDSQQTRWPCPSVLTNDGGEACTPSKLLALAKMSGLLQPLHPVPTRSLISSWTSVSILLSGCLSLMRLNTLLSNRLATKLKQDSQFPTSFLAFLTTPTPP